jgi:hypothetical protein
VALRRALATAIPTRSAHRPVPASWIQSTIFVYLGYDSYADNHAYHHGWPETNGGTQWFFAHWCASQQYQRATFAGLLDPRYHIRFFQGWGPQGPGQYDWDNTWEVWTAGDAHYEVVKLCGHVVPSDGFNRGRDRLLSDWVGPHVWVAIQDWKNTARIRQCDGNYAASDGWVDFINILGYSTH